MFGSLYSINYQNIYIIFLFFICLEQLCYSLNSKKSSDVDKNEGEEMKSDSSEIEEGEESLGFFKYWTKPEFTESSSKITGSPMVIFATSNITKSTAKSTIRRKKKSLPTIIFDGKSFTTPEIVQYASYSTPDSIMKGERISVRVGGGDIKEIYTEISALPPITCFKCYIPDLRQASYDDRCIMGAGLRTIQCEWDQVCFVEIQRYTVERGCISPSKVNRTFACKCSFCNNKPHHVTPQSERFMDWRYDNSILKKSFIEDMTICKDCMTYGENSTMDNICREGIYADHVICNPGQLCGTTITGIENNPSVRRGCVDQPAYNSFWYICKVSMCNGPEATRGKINPYILALVRSSSTGSLHSECNLVFLIAVVGFIKYN